MVVPGPPNGQRGNRLVAAFRTQVLVIGSPATADIGVSRNAVYGGASPPDIAAANLTYAVGLGTNWSPVTAGTQLPDPLAPSGENNLAAGVPSGTTVDHEVALRFRFNAQNGGYSTTVRWTATTN